MAKKLSKFKAFEREAPRIPDFTCPSIDVIVETMEELREANADLRESVDYWKSACEEMQWEIDELTDWKKHIKSYVKEY